MEINWIVVGILAVCAVILIVFIIKKNQKDKKEYTDFLNNDYKKVNQDQSDLNNDDC